MGTSSGRAGEKTERRRSVYDTSGDFFRGVDFPRQMGGDGSFFQHGCEDEANCVSNGWHRRCKRNGTRYLEPLCRKKSHGTAVSL